MDVGSSMLINIDITIQSIPRLQSMLPKTVPPTRQRHRLQNPRI